MEVAAPTHVLMVRGSRSVKTERRLVGGLMQAVALEYGLKLAVCEHAVFDALAAGAPFSPVTMRDYVCYPLSVTRN